MDSKNEEQLSWLRAAVSERRLTQSQIAAATGVDQSQVSRILAGRAKRNSENVTALCAFAEKASLASLRTGGGSVSDDAHAIFQDLLSGTDEEQNLMLEILRRLANLKSVWRAKRDSDG
ncbi:helix-turn-helix domain-containing protein [Paraburkholderia fynbosensis]|uniref:helix-turn-helix domain-containing protein n=1 Tax=Paraburkholderia fynbosensis TaxID=1200993 RepID=UPI003CCCD037